MKTTKMDREQLSALVDGELVDPQVEVMLASLRQGDRRDDWDLYHHIGDVMRSDDMAIQFSNGFSAGMAARLEVEPAIVSPMPAVSGKEARWRSMRYLSMPGMAAAIVMIVGAYILMPSLNTSKDQSAFVIGAAAPDTGRVGKVAVRTAGPAQAVILRDPRIDDYLFAHQRYSPSLYSTAQYARSATFSSK